MCVDGIGDALRPTRILPNHSLQLPENRVFLGKLPFIAFRHIEQGVARQADFQTSIVLEGELEPALVQMASLQSDKDLGERA